MASKISKCEAMAELHQMISADHYILADIMRRDGRLEQARSEQDFAANVARDGRKHLFAALKVQPE